MNRRYRLLGLSILVVIALGIAVLVVRHEQEGEGIEVGVEEKVTISGVSGTDNGQWLDDVHTDLSRYEPGQSVRLTARLTNRQDRAASGQLVFSAYHLSEPVAELRSAPLTLAVGATEQVTIEWLPPSLDYRGYLIEARFIVDDEVKDHRNTAVDVSSDWGRFPRYGYLVNFGDLDREAMNENIERLNGYHINGLQFYDWQYKHHQPLPDDAAPGSVWDDIAKRDVYFDTVKGYIDLAHERNMMAMNYNLLFGSYRDAEQDGVSPLWGLYKDAEGKEQDGHPLPSSWATNRILLYNPVDVRWQQYLFEEEKKVFAALKFDGFHVDQLGDRGTLYDANGNVVKLSKTFLPFLNAAKERLDTRLVMNAVSQFGQGEIVQAPVDFLYAEVWPNGGSTYEQLKSAIDSGRNLSKGSKNTVLAAYMNYGKADRPGEFNAPSVLLANAVIFASGGSHIELGDTGMLGKEYFPNDNLKMTEELEQSLMDYYHFLVAYENLLRDGVTGTDNGVIIDGTRAFAKPLPGSVWTFSRKKQGYEIVHLVNLTGNTKILWRDDLGEYVKPDPLLGSKVKYYTDMNVGNVYWASPDLKHGTSGQLAFERGSDEQGAYVAFTVPELLYWDMVYMEEAAE
ncbi:glycoside hydrolase family 66 protein [Cohnella yongneupensis]|uniref:Glycoside hydrolase family 66 protein n=1 Tax=Cohnella yongneupensis TaxID=425006 RepID=A0ABW0R2L1_9BACL